MKIRDRVLQAEDYFLTEVDLCPGRRIRMRNQGHWARLLAVGLLFGSASLPRLNAQSLDPNKPAPLQPGINKGTADNMVGPQYWLFTAGPGEVKVVARFKSMGLLGNATQATINVVLTDDKRTWKTAVPLSAAASFNEKVIPGKFDKKQKVILEIVPPPNGLVRSGGDYQLEATGAVEFSSPENTGVDPIVKTYAGGRGLCKFLPDGRVIAADGTEGKWKLFDADTRVYSINYPGYSPESVKLVPGRGLVDASDGSTLVYTETHK